MSFGEAEALKRRAEAFLRNAESLLEAGEWDLAVFNLEQHCQLILKYRLLVAKGVYPRTHSIRRLLRELASEHPELLSLVEEEDKLHYLARLEEAYIASRGLPYTYEEREARSLYRFVREVFRPLVEGVR